MLAETCRAADARGLRVARVDGLPPWRPPGEYPDCATQNAFGDLYPADLCPANPDVRAYVRALVADVARYEVATIFAESCTITGSSTATTTSVTSSSWARARVICSGCASASTASPTRAASASTAARFGPRCGTSSSASSPAIALPTMKPSSTPDELAAVADGELTAYLDARADIVATLAAEATEAAAARGRRFVFLELAGAVKGYASGRADRRSRRRERLADGRRPRPRCNGRAERSRCSDTRPTSTVYGSTSRPTVSSSVTVRSPLPCDRRRPTARRRRTWPPRFALARDSGAVRVDFYHYGFVRLDALDWIRAAVEA